LSAIHHLHVNQICHKDIKPENIIVTLDDERVPVVKLIDFNISQNFEKDHILSQAGTKAFMAPE